MINLKNFHILENESKTSSIFSNTPFILIFLQYPSIFRQNKKDLENRKKKHITLRDTDHREHKGLASIVMLSWLTVHFSLSDKVDRTIPIS